MKHKKAAPVKDSNGVSRRKRRGKVSPKRKHSPRIPFKGKTRVV